MHFLRKSNRTAGPHRPPPMHSHCRSDLTGTCILCMQVEERASHSLHLKNKRWKATESQVSRQIITQIPLATQTFHPSTIVRDISCGYHLYCPSGNRANSLRTHPPNPPSPRLVRPLDTRIHPVSLRFAVDLSGLVIARRLIRTGFSDRLCYGVISSWKLRSTQLASGVAWARPDGSLMAEIIGSAIKYR